MAGGRRKSNTVASKQKDAVEEAAKDAAAEQAAVDARGEGGAASASAVSYTHLTLPTKRIV